MLNALQSRHALWPSLLQPCWSSLCPGPSVFWITCSSACPSLPLLLPPFSVTCRQCVCTCDVTRPLHRRLCYTGRVGCLHNCCAVRRSRSSAKRGGQGPQSALLPLQPVCRPVRGRPASLVFGPSAACSAILCCTAVSLVVTTAQAVVLVKVAPALMLLVLPAPPTAG